MNGRNVLNTLINRHISGRKLVALFAADKLLHPEIHNNPDNLQTIANLETVIERNIVLIETFSSFFNNDFDSEETKELYAKLARKLEAVSFEDLIHLPGRAHEYYIRNTKCKDLKSSLRKKHGTFYTPSGTVKSMLKRSIKHLAGSVDSNKIIYDFKAIDPACGSGSFLTELLKLLIGYGVSAEKALNMLYGFDIDPEAVELCKFMLTTVVLSFRPEYGVRYLKTSLDARIRHGNFLKDNFLTKEGKDIRFDLVLGNPPYVSNRLIPAEDKKFYKHNFSSAIGQFDLSIPFIEKGLKILKKQGVLCFITSNKFMASDYGREIRKELIENNTLVELMDVSVSNTFKGTSIYPVIMTVVKGKHPSINIVSIINTKGEKIRVKQDFFKLHKNYLITTQLDKKGLNLIKKFQRIEGRICCSQIKCGLAITGFNKWIVKQTKDVLNKRYYPFIQAGNIKPFKIDKFDYIDTSSLTQDIIAKFEGTKMVIPGIAKRLKAAIVNTGCLLGRVYYVQKDKADLNIFYLTVLFNSIVLNFYYSVMYWTVHLQGNFFRFNSTYLADLPVPGKHDFKNKLHYELVKKIEILGEMLVSCNNLTGIEDEYILAEACVFKLYGFNLSEADYMMRYLNVKTQIRELILKKIKEVQLN